MRIVPHPFLGRDIVGMAKHVFAISGDGAATRRRVSEVRDLIEAIVAEPGLGTALDGNLASWRVRHGGKGRRITVVFRYDLALDTLYLALVAFGGRNWETHAARRSGFGERET